MSHAAKHLHLSFGSLSHPLLRVNNVPGASQDEKMESMGGTGLEPRNIRFANDPMRFRLTRQTSFWQRHLKLWSNNFLLLWPVCFIRLFSGSTSKDDYFTLGNALIMANVAKAVISTYKSSLEELLIMILDNWLESGFGFGSSSFFLYF